MTLEGGAVDRSAGLSFHQIAMAGRSLHRSQDMGRLQDLGPSPVRLALIEDRTGQGTDGLFAGVDTLTGASALPPPASAADPAALLALRARSAQTGASTDELAHLDRAIAAATGVVCDAEATTTASWPGSGWPSRSSVGTPAANLAP